MVEEAYLPLTLTAPGITDAQFQELCEQYADFRVEYTADGELLVMPPTDSETGSRNAEITFQLRAWFHAFKKGRVTDSSSGFLLPNGARFAPDSAWISTERLRRKPTCPEFVIELLSPGDRRKKVHAKMLEWIDNGAELGWMIDPRTETVTIYRTGQEPEVLTKPTKVDGEGPVAGFTLELEPVWRPD